MSSCFDLSYCNGHGVCVLGRCECVDGFAGADCSARGGADPDFLPQWAVALIVLGSCMAFSILLFGVGKVVRYLQNTSEGASA
jgi:EGF-like domain